MGTLNAINPLDNFNKGLRIMFYVQGGKKINVLAGQHKWTFNEIESEILGQQWSVLS